MDIMKYEAAVMASDILDKIDNLYGLIGVITGGLITWGIMREQVQEQFENQIFMLTYHQKLDILKAFKSVYYEVVHNNIQLEKTRCFIESKGHKKIFALQQHGLDNLFKHDKWDKFNDEIDIITGFDEKERLREYYREVAYEVKYRKVTREKIVELLEDGKILEAELVKAIEESENALIEK